MSTANPSVLHQAARDFALAGIPVFPCEVDGKRPACANGLHDATTDLGQIDQWWGENEYNIGVCPEDAGWAVLDVEHDGLLLWEQHARELKVPDTYTVGSPRGGVHLYFEGSCRNSVKTLFDKEPIDTRGKGGYVLVPPSIVLGKPYTVLHDRDIAPLPGFVNERLTERTRERSQVDTELDRPAALDRARAFLLDCVKRNDVAVAGQGGDNKTYQIACRLHELGVSPEASRELLSAHWNPHCVPPWTEDELSVKIENATRYSQNEESTYAVASPRETFGSALDKLLSESAKVTRRSRFHPEDDDEMDLTPAGKWLIDQILPWQATVLLFGATQSFKSFIALAMAWAKATGVHTLGFHLTEPEEILPTFYAALEGRADIKRKRRVALRMANSVTGKTAFYVMPAPMIAYQEEVEEFVAQLTEKLAGRQCGMIVFDTVSKMMVGLDPTRDAPRFVRFCDAMVERFGCTVMAIGHSGHDVKKGMRDSTAYHAGFDTVIELQGDRRTKTTNLTVLKHKDEDEPADTFHFKGELVGPSLVFSPITPDEAHKIHSEDDPVDRLKVGAALQRLNAYGLDNGVTTDVLATELAPVLENETPEQHEEAKTKTARALSALSRSRLQGYCDKVEKSLIWFLPKPTGECPVE
jgi:hypothetical protein